MSTLKTTSLLLASVLLIGHAAAEPKVTYAGLGRYTCSGSAAECREVNRRNDELLERDLNKATTEQANWIMRESLDEKRRQTKLLEEIRDQGRR